MAYITNDGSRLIDRARTEGKSIVFSSVRMNTIYKSDPYSLVQQTDEWFGENHGSVVGCLSHVSVDEVSQVCDSKLAVQCNDNSESWKSIGIYAHLDGEVDELLFACESIENGEYKDVTIVELPVTLDGVVADFGLSEGGSGGGGGGEVPANVMTTDTNQTDLTGMKRWSWENYIGGGTVDAPQDGAIRSYESFTIHSIEGEEPAPLILDTVSSTYDGKMGAWGIDQSSSLQLTSSKVVLNDLSTTWADIINATKIEQGFDRKTIHVWGGSTITIDDVEVKPNSEIKIGDYAVLVFDSNSNILSVRANGCVLDVSAAVIESSTAHRARGIVSSSAHLPFEDSPLTPAEGQEIYVHWTRYQ